MSTNKALDPLVKCNKAQRTYSISDDSYRGSRRPTPPATPKNRRRLSDDGNMGIRSGNRSLPNPNYPGQTIFNKYVSPKNEKMIRDKIQSNRLRASSVNSSSPVKAVPIQNKAQKENSKPVLTQITDLKRNSSTTSSCNLDKRRSRSHTDINTLTPALAGGSSSLRFATTENRQGIGNGVGVGPASTTSTLKEMSNSIRSSTPSLVQANEKDENRSKKSNNNISGIFSRRSSERNSFSLKDRLFNRKISASTGDIDKGIPSAKEVKSDKDCTKLKPFRGNIAGSNAGVVGLKNLGNTCFMNSILQCLSNTKALTSFVLDNSYARFISGKSSMHGKLMEAYASLMRSMWKSDTKETALSPATFKSQIQRFAPRFVGYSQQDAQEFLRFLLAGLHEDLLHSSREQPKIISSDVYDELQAEDKATYCWKLYKSTDDSKVAELFVGQLKSTLECTSCKNQSVTFDPFWDLSLPIPKTSDTSIVNKISVITLLDCLKLFTREETLSGDNMPTCSRCKTKTVSTKKLSIQKFPQILVIHFKRFSGMHYRTKLNTLIDFPIDILDLLDFAGAANATSCKYNLYAISNHSGSTVGGHYTAYCKSPHTQTWYMFNDTRVQPVASNEVKSSQAYVLFYEQQLTQSIL